MKPSVYIETTVASYYVSRDSRDVVVLAHQQITRAWWQARIGDFRCFVSPVVLEESRAGDAAQARSRLGALEPFEVLEANARVEALAASYFTDLNIPDRAIRDAAHLAFACAYEIDFLVTWNCTHLANGQVIRRLARFNALAGTFTPTICTPEALLIPEEGQPMSADPIVEEVRKAGEQLASGAGNDVHRFFEKLREVQRGYARPLVREPIPRQEVAGRTTQSS